MIMGLKHFDNNLNFVIMLSPGHQLISGKYAKFPLKFCG